MEHAGPLYEIAKALLAEDDELRVPELVLRAVLPAIGAVRGFIVVREGDGYEERFAVDCDALRLGSERLRLSRSLVRQVIESREVVCSADILGDERFSLTGSLRAEDVVAVVAAPLHYAGETYGAVYVELPAQRYDAGTERFLKELAVMSGLALRRAIERANLRERNRSLERDLFARHDFAGILTHHPKMIEMLRVLAQVADSRASILIRGESGTGKELVARAIHLNSDRRKKPYVALHCAALAGTLLESELFGHVKGAFTGALRERQGRIAAAEGGTLFLDEVGEIPLDVQAKLLRFTQFGELQRIGSDEIVKADVRIVAATHRDLKALVADGRFRQDLYYRLRVVELEVPPLRERLGDIELLADHFLRAHWTREGVEPRFTAAAVAALRRYHYPGNVRELSHAVERACLLARGPQIDEALLPPEMLGSAPVELARGPVAAAVEAWPQEALSNDALQAARERAVDKVERAFLVALLAHSEGNVSQAARTAGMQRSYLQKLLARHHIEK